MGKLHIYPRMDKIIGIGNALTDVLVAMEDDALLSRLRLPTGGMTLIDASRLAEIDASLKGLSHRISTGGSAANTIAALAHLRVQTGFVGKVGDDRYGRFFAESLGRQGTDGRLAISRGLPSGVAMTFISPDGERTFATHLGAAADLKAGDLSGEMFAGGLCLYVEGYLVQDPAMMGRAMALAKEAGLTICMDLASYNVVAANRDFFRRMLAEQVDIVFANEEEAKAFTGKEPCEALAELAGLCSIAVVKVGKRGSMVRKAQETVCVGAEHVEHVADTTGAGDFFAAGFLYGLTCGYSLERCARAGSLLAAYVIQTVGTTLSADKWDEINDRLQNNAF